jgi:hypothetical protein
MKGESLGVVVVASETEEGCVDAAKSCVDHLQCCVARSRRGVTIVKDA